MTNIWMGLQWNTSPTALLTIDYERERDGADMKYRLHWRVWLKYSTSYLYDALYFRFYVNGVRYDETIKVRNTNETGWDYSGTSDWYTVPNKTSGTTPFYCAIYDYNASKIMFTSETKELDIVGAASSLGTISDFDIDGGFTIPITKYDSNYTDNLSVSYNGNACGTWIRVSNGQKITFSDTMLAKIYSLMSTVNSGTFTFKLTTMNGSTVVGTSTAYADGAITNATPTMDADKVAYRDTNDVTRYITENDQYIVQKQSTMAVTFEDAVGQKGASIVSYTMSVHGTVLEMTRGGTYPIGKIDSSTNVEISIVAKDSRGNTVECKKKVTIVPWATPTFKATLERLNNYEDTTYITIDATIYSVMGKNFAEGFCRYRELGGTYGEWSAIAVGNTVEQTYDKEKSWQIQIKVQDIFDTSTATYTLDKGVFPLFIDTEKNAVGINDFPTEGEGLRVNGGVMNVCGNKITNVGYPEDDGDAVPLGAIKGILGGSLSTIHESIVASGVSSLEHDFTQYDAVIVVATELATYRTYTHFVPMSVVALSGSLAFLLNFGVGNSYIRFGGDGKSVSAEFDYSAVQGKCTIDGLYGVKFSGGSGGSTADLETWRGGSY